MDRKICMNNQNHFQIDSSTKCPYQPSIQEKSSHPKFNSINKKRNIHQNGKYFTSNYYSSALFFPFFPCCNPFSSFQATKCAEEPSSGNNKSSVDKVNIQINGMQTSRCRHPSCKCKNFITYPNVCRMWGNEQQSWIMHLIRKIIMKRKISGKILIHLV